MGGALPPDWSRWRRQQNVTDYDERWHRIEAAGGNPHGEADFVASYHPRSVLDGGCGTGRVAIELARRGIDVAGADLDRDMIDAARVKAPELTWLHADLSALDFSDVEPGDCELGDFESGTGFDVVVLAGNVIPYVAAERRSAAVLACARHLVPGGRLISGFQLQPGWPTLADYDGWCERAALVREARYATWERAPFTDTSAYAVSVHRRE